MHDTEEWRQLVAIIRQAELTIETWNRGKTPNELKDHMKRRAALATRAYLDGLEGDRHHDKVTPALKPGDEGGSKTLVLDLEDIVFRYKGRMVAGMSLARKLGLTIQEDGLAEVDEAELVDDPPKMRTWKGTLILKPYGSKEQRAALVELEEEMSPVWRLTGRVVTFNDVTLSPGCQWHFCPQQGEFVGNGLTADNLIVTADGTVTTSGAFQLKV